LVLVVAEQLVLVILEEMGETVPLVQFPLLVEMVEHMYLEQTVLMEEMVVQAAVVEEHWDGVMEIQELMQVAQVVLLAPLGLQQLQ
jgi:hypothetical protein